ncbi:MAG: DUF5615 family PIN-like protein, partial [Patescibacteria group bacterium]
DENLGSIIPKYLKSVGFNIIWVQKTSPGQQDFEILQLAVIENRILITLDKDFGELVFKEKLTTTGVIFLRLKDESIKNKKRVLLSLLNSKKDLYGKFTVVTESKVRIKSALKADMRN